jgi:hypothetical protein
LIFSFSENRRWVADSHFVFNCFIWSCIAMKKWNHHLIWSDPIEGLHFHWHLLPLNFHCHPLSLEYHDDMRWFILYKLKSLITNRQSSKSWTFISLLNQQNLAVFKVEHPHNSHINSIESEMITEVIEILWLIWSIQRFNKFWNNGINLTFTFQYLCKDRW